MKYLIIATALLFTVSAEASQKPHSKIRMNFEKTAKTDAQILPFHLKDHRFNVSLGERMNAVQAIANNPKTSKIEEKAVKILSFGFEF
jgi:hypothetical protein